MSRPADYRFVWKPLENHTDVVAAMSPGWDAALDGRAGELLWRLSRGDPSVPQEAPRFIERCQSYGWVTKEGRLAGKITRLEDAPHLKRVQVELTLHCNLSCSYCYSESGPLVQGIALPVQRVEALLQGAADMGVIWVDFTGGEFFLYRGWQAVLEQARQLGLVVSIHTNGVAVSRERAEAIAAQGVRHVQVSIDSHVASVHDEARGRAGALARSVAGIRRLQAAGIHVIVSVVLHRGNVDAIADTVAWLNDLGVEVLLDRVIPTGGELEAGVGISAKEFYEAVAPLIRRDAKATRICENKASREGVAIEPECGVAHSFVYVTAGGEIALCPTMTARDSVAFAMAPNIRTMTLADAWYRSDYFTEHRGLNCRNTAICGAAEECGGGCRSNAYLETGELDAPDAVQCNMNKNPTDVYVDFLGRYKRGVFEPVT